jgi:hypothetical protein
MPTNGNNGGNATGVVMGVDEVGAIVRTALSKSGSSNSLKKGNTVMHPAQATKDEVVIDSLRGNQYRVDGLVLLTGDVTIDPMQEGIAERLDRVKLVAESVLDILKNGGVLTKASIETKMRDLWNLYATNSRVKQPTSEQFDELLGEAFSTTLRDAMLTPTSYTQKKGNFVVRDLKVQVVAASSDVAPNVGSIVSIDTLNAKDQETFGSLLNSISVPRIVQPIKAVDGQTKTVSKSRKKV